MVSLYTAMAWRYSLISMCSSVVWSRCESPGPYVTMGRFIALPRRFMSPVPVLRRSVAGLFRMRRTEEESTWTMGEDLLASKGSTVSSMVGVMLTLGLVFW